LKPDFFMPVHENSLADSASASSCFSSQCASAQPEVLAIPSSKTRGRCASASPANEANEQAESLNVQKIQSWMRGAA
jgi:hypothetical protein